MRSSDWSSDVCSCDHAELTREWSNQLINQIRAVDPNYRFDSLGFPQTLHGQVNQLNTLRFDQAVAFLRTGNEVRPLQVETLRFVQERVDQAYAEGIKLLRAGRDRKSTRLNSSH